VQSISRRSESLRDQFAGAGVFKCCEGDTGAWRVGGGVDVPVAVGVSVGGDFGLVGPTGDGIVLERSVTRRSATSFSSRSTVRITSIVTMHINHGSF